MYLKSLTLNGFKSFAKKTPLVFNSPITSVVGPNGSGKSNIVESIRFVLGEQSMKSLRGKGGVDLIFKGSKHLSALSRASVSMSFDNSKKVFSFSGGLKDVHLDYDEITISREVYSDGKNVYQINGTEVRLKDIMELLASVNIGSSSHHIISQGEADRVLNASVKDRRVMIEDALGLKVYQYKIKESERKLEKTTANLKEVESLRREIAPHITFLKKQVEKFEKARGMRLELKDYYREYFSREATRIKTKSLELSQQKKTIQDALLEIEQKLNEYQDDNSQALKNSFNNEIANHERTLYSLRSVKDEIGRKIGRLEGMLEALSNQKESAPAEIKSQAVPFEEVEVLFEELTVLIESALMEDNVAVIHYSLNSMKENLDTFVSAKKNRSERIVENNDTNNNQEKMQEYISAKDALTAELVKIEEDENKTREEIEKIRAQADEQAYKMRDAERALYEVKAKKNELSSKLQILSLEDEAINKARFDFDNELKEASVLSGPESCVFVENFSDAEGVNVEIIQQDLRRKIERIKIKLEDLGGSGGELIKEHDEAVARDAFLAHEVEDIKASISSLQILIRELKSNLDMDFKTGVEKINKQFQEFFSLMFGGGSAFLSVVVEHKRPNMTEDEDSEVDEDAELQFERGIEINVSLPHKKVKDLHMLSGGERSLTSIALLFAISQVNPPPFLVLDETDAALDESNSRKYGDMLENLSKYSQLIVVTHNRETMSRANILYGITIGADGGSKLLSIKLDEAVQIAK